MSERVNLDTDLLEDDGDGLYVARNGMDDHLILEERPDDPVDVDGGYLTSAYGDDPAVLVTSELEDGGVALQDVETTERVDTLFASEVDGREIPRETLADRELVALSLVN